MASPSCIPNVKEVLLNTLDGVDFNIRELFCILLRNICASDFVLAERQSKMLVDLAWERLNTGHWKDVPESWRRVYSAGSLAKAVSILRCQFEDALSSSVSANQSDAFASATNQQLVEALRCIDMALLMGAPLACICLTSIASRLHALLSKSHLPTEPTPSSIPSTEPVSKRAKLASITLNMDEQCKLTALETLDPVDFQLNFLGPSKPVLIQTGIEHWPAFQKWCVDYIRQVAGFRTVPIEIGSRYTDDEWTQKLMTINQFIARFMTPSDTDVDKSGVGYLAQHELFDQIPELREDILIPDYCYSGESTEDESAVHVNGWFGPGGTVSPLHFDPKHNILVQIFGSKYVRLYAPDASVYPMDSGMLSNTSQVNVESPDLEQFPEFAKAQYFECILEAGQQLFIPQKWWHFVRSLEPSFSVSYWFC